MMLVAAALVAGCASAPRSGSGTPLRVMSYNIRSGNGNLEGTAAAIRAWAPDVVALQEVDVHWAERSNFVDQASALGERLGMQVRFAHIYQLPGASAAQPAREFGVALLSRYPIVRSRNDTLTRLSTQEAAPVPTPMPGLLEATIDVRGTPVRVFNTHLDYRSDPRVRARQVAEMLAYIGSPSGPTLVFGDMNAKPDAPELQPLLHRLHDAWPTGAGPGFTYPAEAPSERIDYVLVSPHFHLRSASVPATEASDHRPVVVDLLLTPRGPTRGVPPSAREAPSPSRSPARSMRRSPPLPFGS